MDILAGRCPFPPVSLLPMPRPSNTVPDQAVISSQVSGGRHFFLDLSPGKKRALNLVYGGYEQCNPDYVIQRNNFAYHVLEFVAAGAGTLTINGRTTSLRPGVVYSSLTTSRLEMRADPASPMGKYFLCFTGTHAADQLSRAGIEPQRAYHLAMFPEVQNVLEDIIREGQHHRRTAPQICAALVEVLLLKIQELTQLSSRNNDKAEEVFLRCKSVIDGSTKTLNTLTQIAEAAGVDSSQLCRLFRRYQGLSPYQYLLHRKMTLAGELLMDSSCLVKQAAELVGFSDPYHFSRCFKKVHGLPPKEFQNSLRRL